MKKTCKNAQNDNSESEITSITAYINQLPKDIEGITVKYCPHCKARRLTKLENCSYCECKYEYTSTNSGGAVFFDPGSLAMDWISYTIEKRRKLLFKKLIKGKYISVGESAFGITKPGDTVIFNRIYCNLQTKKDMYAITKDSYGYNLLIQPYPSGEVTTFTLESKSNGDIIARNETHTILLRPIK